MRSACYSLCTSKVSDQDHTGLQCSEKEKREIRGTNDRLGLAALAFVPENRVALRAPGELEAGEAG
jgi:hypothetical protein